MGRFAVALNLFVETLFDCGIPDLARGKRQEGFGQDFASHFAKVHSGFHAEFG